MDIASWRRTLGRNQLQPLDHSRVWLMPTDQSPEVMDFQSDSGPVTLPAVGSSTNILGWFGTNLLCRWNGTHQVLVHQLRGSEFLPIGALTLQFRHSPDGLRLPTDIPTGGVERKDFLDLDLPRDPHGARPSD